MHCRRKLAQASNLPVGVSASGFVSTNTADSAVHGFTAGLSTGTLQSQMLSLAQLSISSAAYVLEPIITTPSVSVDAVDAPASSHSSTPGTRAALYQASAQGHVVDIAASLIKFCKVSKHYFSGYHLKSPLSAL